MMFFAVIGEILFLLIGAWALIGSLIAVKFMLGYSGKMEWALIIPFIVGVFLVWCAVHYGPISLVIL